MVKRVRMMCEHGTSVEFAWRGRSVTEVVGRIEQGRNTLGPVRFVLFEDVLGNEIAVDPDKVVAVLMEELPEDEKVELRERRRGRTARPAGATGA